MKGRGEDRTAAFLRSRLKRAELDATVQLTYEPKRSGAANQSPDFLVHVEVRVPLFDGHVAIVRAPIFIEVEAGAGFEAALADLERFVERGSEGNGRQGAVIELPFLVVTEAGEGRTRELSRTLPSCLRMTEIAVPVPPVDEGEPG